MFEAHPAQLVALVRQRLVLEWQFHQRNDLARLENDLTELLREFGQWLRVIYRYDMRETLAHEAAWYASVLAARGPDDDAWKLALGSWIIAIQGVIKPPKCNRLAAPLQELRGRGHQLFAEAQAQYIAPPSAPARNLAERLVASDLVGASALLQSDCDAGVLVPDLILRLIFPAMAEIGRR